MAGYEIKIKLERTGSWRNVQVPARITFETLHEIIQIIYAWDNAHMHDFMTDGRRVNVVMEGTEGYGDINYSEETTAIDEILLNSKWICYTYDFGDNWEHKITLMKELPDYDHDYAVVKRYKGDNWTEDWSEEQWYEFDEPETTPFIMETVNEALQKMKYAYAKTSGKSGKKKEKQNDTEFEEDEVLFSFSEEERDAWLELYKIGELIEKKNPWKKFEIDQLFQIAFSKQEERYFSFNHEVERVLTMYCGESGLNQFFGIFDMVLGAIPESEYWSRLNCLKMVVTDEKQVPRLQYQIIQQLGLQFPKGKWIYFESMEASYIPFICSLEEVKLLKKYLTKLIEAYDYFVGEKEKWKTELFQYVYTEEKGVWKGAWQHLPITEYEIPVEKVSDLVMHKLKKCKKNAQIWELAERSLEIAIGDEAYAKPMIPSVVLIADSKKKKVIGKELSTPETREGLLIEVLSSTIQECGIPKKIIIDNPYVEAKIQDLCEQLDIKMEFDDLGCCEAEIDSLTEYLNSEGFVNDKVHQFFEHMEEAGVDMLQMQKDMQKLSESAFMAKYADVMAGFMTDMLAIDPDEDDFWGDDFYEDDFFELEDDYREFVFHDRKEKVDAIKDYYGKGKLFGDDFHESAKLLDYDMPEKSWRELLRESSPKELMDMAERMGALVDSKMSQKVLADIIIAMYEKRHKNLYDLLSNQELDFLKHASKAANSIDTEMPIDCVDIQKEDLLHLLALGLIDIAAEYVEGEFILYVSPIEEVNWKSAKH